MTNCKKVGFTSGRLFRLENVIGSFNPYGFQDDKYGDSGLLRLRSAQALAGMTLKKGDPGMGSGVTSARNVR